LTSLAIASRFAGLAFLAPLTFLAALSRVTLRTVNAITSIAAWFAILDLDESISDFVDQAMLELDVLRSQNRNGFTMLRLKEFNLFSPSLLELGDDHRPSIHHDIREVVVAPPIEFVLID
jgi:hypothetical protein